MPAAWLSDRAGEQRAQVGWSAGRAPPQGPTGAGERWPSGWPAGTHAYARTFQPPS
jgi:hypothetical protein